MSDMDHEVRSARMLGCEISTNPLDPLEPILKMCEYHHPDEDMSILARAYRRAVNQHSSQRRKSGEPYIIHPLAVAQILADLGMGPLVVAAGLLHDTVEDTDYTLDECRAEFGDTVTGLVDGVTKLSKMEYGDSAQAETIRKMVVAMSRDVRVLVVKLADRVHNARTWRYVKQSNAQKKARETLDVYAPLANRLGMNAIKTELEELSFKVLYPKIYNEIVVLVARRAGQRDVYLKQILAEINEDLDEQHIKAYVTGRPKDYFSIYQKMIVRGHDFANIYDLVGVRIIVDTIQDCYAALGAVHARWNPVPGRFKDYIAMPKLNMYQSLHTTVVGPGGKPVEIQIRTWDMHRRAEFGIAAHWKYKENGQAGRALSSPDKSDRKRGENQELSEADNLKWIQQLADWTSETPDSDEFLGSLKEDLGAAEVYVFTPKGKIVSLPAEATPIDFAYAVHTEVGHRTMGARVNGRLVPLDTKLENGDTVEILTSKSESAGPSRDWLSFAKSPKARNKIRQWFSKERRTEAVEEGRDELTRAMRKRNLPITTLLTPEALVGVADELNLANAEADKKCGQDRHALRLPHDLLHEDLHFLRAQNAHFRCRDSRPVCAKRRVLRQLVFTDCIAEEILQDHVVVANGLCGQTALFPIVPPAVFLLPQVIVLDDVLRDLVERQVSKGFREVDSICIQIACIGGRLSGRRRFVKFKPFEEGF